MNKSIFSTRFKKCYQDKGWTQDRVAMELNVSVDTVKKYLRSGAKLPPLDITKKIAKIFNVDVAYLLGEQDCKKHQEQTICDVTSLDANASEILVNLNELLVSVLNDLLKHPRIETLLFYILKYVNSHNKEITISNPINPKDKETIYSGREHREILKFSATDVFGQIIDDLYEEKRPSAEKAMLYHIQKELLLEIQKNRKIIEYPEGREVIEKIIINRQKQMALIDKEYILVKLAPKTIIENIDLLVNELILDKS